MPGSARCSSALCLFPIFLYTLEFTHPTLEFYYFVSCEITLSYLNFTAISSCCFLVPTQTHRDEPRNLSTRVCQCISFCTENGWSSWPQLVLHLWLLLGHLSSSIWMAVNSAGWCWPITACCWQRTLSRLSSHTGRCCGVDVLPVLRGVWRSTWKGHLWCVP